MTYMQRPRINCCMVRNLPARSRVRHQDLQADSANLMLHTHVAMFIMMATFSYLVRDGMDKFIFYEHGLYIASAKSC